MVVDEPTRPLGQPGHAPPDGTAAAGTRPRAGQLLGVVLAGGLGWVVDVSLLWLLHEVLGVAVPPAAAVGFTASALVNFAVNRLVFGATRRAVPGQLVRYGVLFAGNLLAVSLLVGPLARLVGPALGGGGAGLLAAKVVLTLVLLPVNATAYRRWVFR